MEPELERLRRANAELQAWVRDLLTENRTLRARLAGDEAEAANSDEPVKPRPLAACS